MDGFIVPDDDELDAEGEAALREAEAGEEADEQEGAGNTRDRGKGVASKRGAAPPNTADELCISSDEDANGGPKRRRRTISHDSDED